MISINVYLYGEMQYIHTVKQLFNNETHNVQLYSIKTNKQYQEYASTAVGRTNVMKFEITITTKVTKQMHNNKCSYEFK